VPIHIEDFTKKPDAAYRAELEKHQHATVHLFSLLNDPENEQRMVHLSEVELPALLGVPPMCSTAWASLADRTCELRFGVVSVQS
jgi:hypothetical protein